MRKVEEEWNTSEWQGRTREQIDSFYLNHGDPYLNVWQLTRLIGT